MSYNNRKRGGPIKTVLALIRLLQKAPSTRGELAQALGAHPDRIGNYLCAMYEIGMVMREKQKLTEGLGHAPDLWTWVG